MVLDLKTITWVNTFKNHIFTFNRCFLYYAIKNDYHYNLYYSDYLYCKFLLANYRKNLQDWCFVSSMCWHNHNNVIIRYTILLSTIMNYTIFSNAYIINSNILSNIKIYQISEFSKIINNIYCYWYFYCHYFCNNTVIIKIYVGKSSIYSGRF